MTSAPKACFRGAPRLRGAGRENRDSTEARPARPRDRLTHARVRLGGPRQRARRTAFPARPHAPQVLGRGENPAFAATPLQIEPASG